MQELIDSSDSLDNNIVDEQMKSYVKEVNKSYKQAIKYNRYIGSQGRSAREQGEVKLKELLSDVEQKVEVIGKMNELKIKNIDDLKNEMKARNLEVDNQYKKFGSILKSKLDIENGIMVIKLIRHKKNIQDLYSKFTKSCENKVSFEVAKLAKQFISEKEAFESVCENFQDYLTNRSFRVYFYSLIKEQDLSLSEQAPLAKIDRKTPISEVPEKWRMAFAVARGRAIVEKVNCLPDRDINTENKFNSRYESKIHGYDFAKGDFEVSTWVKTQRFPRCRYINYVDTKNGIIIAKYNFRDDDASDGSGKPLPNSEILYNQLLLALSHQSIASSEFNLTRVIRENIANKETCNTLDCCIKNLGKEQSASKGIYKFKRGSEGYYAILGTPNAYSTLYLLKQHSSVFGEKEITDIEVGKHVSGRPKMILHIN